MTAAEHPGAIRNLVHDAVPVWREAWSELRPSVRAMWILVTAAGVLSALVVGLQIGSESFLLGLSNTSYVVVPVAAGGLLVLGARASRGPGRLAWTLIGSGVALWGLGETTWVFYTAVLGFEEVPYPGVADIFYVGAYPIIFAGVLLLPHVQSRRWERARLSLDAVAGTVAVAAITWTFYLKDAVYIDPDAGLMENFTNLGYPVGDLWLLVAIMILATRRSQLQFDGRLLLLSGAMLITAIADMMYVFQYDTYADGSALDGLWLVAYTLFGITALAVAGPVRLREQADRPGRIWPMIAPYTAVLVLFALTVGEIGGQASTLQTATAAVGVLIIARQGVAIRETRDIVEKQRNDLVASISHELRTPLTAMSGFTQLLDQDPDLDRDERVEMISIVNAQTNHLSRIVGDLVEVARDNLDSTNLSYATIDVSSLVTSAIEMLTDGAAEAHITTNIQPGLTIAGDEDRLRQVLVNYLTNAGRYGRGNVQVHAHVVANGETLVEVHDNGPGIPKKYEITIWDRFERGEQRFLSGVQGSGLGLAIARQLVSAHGGHTGHRPSELLGGSCFWLTVPSRLGSGAARSEAASRV